MVPYVMTFGVVVYVNQTNELLINQELIRDALIQGMPPGTGVGKVSITNHGVYEAHKE
jgi:hypothetical protein